MRKYILIPLLLSVVTCIYASAAGEIVKHVIQPNETVFHLSLVYNSTVADIVHVNPGMVAEKIRSGSTIKIPQNTKIRDAAFVEAIFRKKTIRIYKPQQLPDPTPAQVSQQQQKPKDAAIAQAPQDTQEDENPFVAPRKKKSIEEMELESALGNNVPPKAFKPAADTKVNTETPISVSAPTPQPQATQSSAAASQASPDKNVQVIDMRNVKTDTTDHHYAEILNQLGTLIDANQVIAINLQIVMKDGTIKNISSPQEQKKILSQLVGSMSSN